MSGTADSLTLNLLTTTIVAPPSNASKWQMGYNSAFKGLMLTQYVQYSRQVNVDTICVIQPTD